jgi:chromosome segregation ATPase
LPLFTPLFLSANRLTTASKSLAALPGICAYDLETAAIRHIAMSETTLLDCEAVRGAFRQFQAEQEPVANELSESLAALTAYQSHLDLWQQQLAREREEIAAERERLKQEFSNDETAAALSEVSAELSAARSDITQLTATLAAQAEELRTAREQGEHDRAAVDSSQKKLAEVTSELTAARNEITTLTKSLLTSADELRAERQRVERNESSAGNQQVKLVELTGELDAARDKISALTTMLLSRTEELRALDVRRAEAGTELELARVRERELKAALEELKQAREWEHSQWADEARHLRELVERRLEGVGSEHPAQRAEQHPPAERHPAKPSEQSPENPVFASVIEQFGKLRQQRAMMERPTSKKAK